MNNYGGRNHESTLGNYKVFIFVVGKKIELLSVVSVLLSLHLSYDVSNRKEIMAFACQK